MRKAEKFFRTGPGRLVLLFLVICLGFVSPAVRSFAEVRTAADRGLELADGETEIIRLMNLNLRYLLNDWWHEEKGYAYASTTNFNSADRTLTEEQRLAVRKSAQTFADWRNVDELSILYLNREQAENGIRPLAHAVYCISMALYGDYYDEEITGVSGADAEAMCIKLISAVTGEHRSNHPDAPDDRNWGDSWQSPLWAENIGLGAWLLRDRMDPEIYEKAERMVLDEAHTLMDDYEIPYYRDADGTVMYPGDTKAEEIAWDAKVLALARFMFPDSEERTGWEDKLECMLVAATAMPQDVGSDRVVDGRKVGTMIRGSNIDADGTLINHNRYHIDYMATVFEEMGDTVVLYRIAGEPVPEAAVFNLDQIYRALIDVDLGKYDESRSGLNFYLRDENGRPTGSVGMPGDNDWGKAGYAIYYLCDVMADTLGLDAEIEESLKACVWEKFHFEKMREQICRNADDKVAGMFFRPGENSFVSVETFMMHNLAEAYLLGKQRSE